MEVRISHSAPTIPDLNQLEVTLSWMQTTHVPCEIILP